MTVSDSIYSLIVPVGAYLLCQVFFGGKWLVRCGLWGFWGNEGLDTRVCWVFLRGMSCAALIAARSRPHIIKKMEGGSARVKLPQRAKTARRGPRYVCPSDSWQQVGRAPGHGIAWTRIARSLLCGVGVLRSGIVPDGGLIGSFFGRDQLA